MIHYAPLSTTGEPLVRRLRVPILRPAPLLAAFAVGFLVIAAADLAPRSSQTRLPHKAGLLDLIREEDSRTRALRARVESLAREIDVLRRRAEGRAGRIGELRRRIDGLAGVAGLTAVAGPGIVVTLTDSSLQRSPTGDPNDLVVHEEDLQAVVNGLWGAGAEAIAINGERITGASAIRCVGNTLLLHGSVYSPPYRIAAIGDARALRDGLSKDRLVERFRLIAQEFKLGLEVADEQVMRLPAFRGLVVSRFADALRS